MYFIGDIHCNFDSYLRIIEGLDKSVQVGDFGVGFPDVEYPKNFDINHKFIRGNHDNPFVCTHHPNCIKDGEYIDGVFYVGGAHSVDKHMRVKDLNWWEEEEVSYQKAMEILDRYVEYKPEIVVSHDCPSIVIEGQSRTKDLLNAMLEFHEPKIWIFGHHHWSLDLVVNKTRFKCLDIEEVFKL